MSKTAAYTITLQDKVSRAAMQMSRSTEKLRRSIHKISKEARTGGASFERLSKGLLKAGNAMKKYSVGAGAMAAGSVKAFADIETGTSMVLGLAGTKSKMDAWRTTMRGVIEDSVMLGEGIDETAQGLFNSVSAFGTSQKAIEAFHAAEVLAIGGSTSVENAMTGMAKVMRAYTKDQLTATEVTNIFYTSQQKGRTNVEQLAGAIGKVAGTANSLNIGFAETAAVLAELTFSADSTDIAATNLAAIMTALIRPTKTARKEFEKLGIPVGATEVSAAGLGKTLMLVNKAYKKDAEAVGILFGNIRAMRGIFGLTEKNLISATQTQKQWRIDMATGGGVVASYNEQMQTLSMQFKLMWGGIKVTAGVLGDKFKPALVFTFRTIRALAFLVRKMSSGFQTFIGVALTVVAALAPMLLFLGKLKTLAFIVKIVSTLGTVLSWAFAAFAPMLTALVTMVGIVPIAIGLAVAGVVALGILLYKHWDAIIAKYEAFKEVLKTAKGFFSSDKDEFKLDSHAETNSTTTLEGEIVVKGTPGTTVESTGLKTSGQTKGLALGIANSGGG